MTLQELTDRIRRNLSSGSSPVVERTERLASSARTDRAGTIARLQDDVHRLQHEIADLSQNPDGDSGGQDKPDADRRIGALQRELEQSQRSLAKLQGRV